MEPHVNANDDATSQAVLEGTWQLESLEGHTLPDPARRRPMLTVTAEGAVHGSTGVNRFSGVLDPDGRGLFGPLATTRRAGPPEAMALEAAFLKALDSATAVEARDDQIVLGGAATPRLILNRTDPAA
jgi:heat shock protein HslJ